MNDLIVYRKFNSLKEQRNSTSGGSILSYLDRYLVDIIRAREGLQSDLKMFSGEKEIWPDQCDRTMLSIDAMQIPIQRLCDLFDDGSPLPVIITTTQLSDELIINSHYVHEELYKLLEHITAFSFICRKPPKQTRNKQEEIARKLDLCLQSIDDILQQIHSLLQKPQWSSPVYTCSPTYTCSEIEPELPGIDQPNDKEYGSKRLLIGKKNGYTRSGKEFPSYLKPVTEDDASEDTTPKDDFDAIAYNDGLYDLTYE
jgi:hypothetical protein